MSISADAPVSAHTTPGAGTTLRGLGLVLITALFWGLNWPVMKFMLAELPPLTSRAVPGMAAAALVLALAALSGRRVRPTRREWPRLALTGVLNFTSFMGLGTVSMLWLTASEAAIISYTLPIWAALLAWPLLGERPTALRIAGLVVGLAGVAVLLGGESLAVSWDKLPGVACAFGTAITFALGLVLTKRMPLALPQVAGLGWQLLFGSLPLVVGAAFFEAPHFAAVRPLGWGLLSYQVLLSLSVAYLLWFRALRLLPASLAAISILMVPVVGVFSAALWLGDPLGVRQIAALGLTLGGVALAVRG